jgi:twitching motility protein PilU
LLGNKTTQDLIYKGDTDSLKEIMVRSENLGMQTFDAALFKLQQAGRISMEEALKNADSENNLRLRIKLAETEDEKAVSAAASSGLAGLSLEKTHEEKAEEERIAKEDAELAELMGA